jgi:hypothetical protein
VISPVEYALGLRGAGFKDMSPKLAPLAIPAEVTLHGPVFQCADFLRRVTLIEEPAGAGQSIINHRRSVPAENH